MHLQVIKVDRILHSVMTHLLRPLGEEYISKIYRKFRSDIHLKARVSTLISSPPCLLPSSFNSTNRERCQDLYYSS